MMISSGEEQKTPNVMGLSGFSPSSLLLSLQKNIMFSISQNILYFINTNDIANKISTHVIVIKSMNVVELIYKEDLHTYGNPNEA